MTMTTTTSQIMISKFAIIFSQHGLSELLGTYVRSSLSSAVISTKFLMVPPQPQATNEKETFNFERWSEI